MDFYRKTWPTETVPPKLHMLESHAADFMESWQAGHGIYGEHGAESIHKVFNTLKRTYCSIPSATSRLNSMLKEHFCRVHPDAQKLRPDPIHRKRPLQERN